MKKEYIKPLTKVVTLQLESLVCNSPVPPQVNLGFDPEQEPEDEGYAD